MRTSGSFALIVKAIEELPEIQSKREDRGRAGVAVASKSRCILPGTRRLFGLRIDAQSKLTPERCSGDSALESTLLVIC